MTHGAENEALAKALWRADTYVHGIEDGTDEQFASDNDREAYRHQADALIASGWRVIPPAERDCNGYALGSSCECASAADCPASRVIPPAEIRLGSCCVNVGTDACTCENPTNWGQVIPPTEGR